jgi:transcriptional regulator with PAS, ATPase and Fis domain
VHVDCASLPAELIEGELFGNEKGAYTNAQAARCGLIEAAEDGTLFLDEIGELPLTLQAKLLNVLERRVVRRLGSTKERPVLARFVAATNRDLNKMVEDGRFRADLYYRLNVLSIHLPPLRNREGDALLLAHHFVAQTERRYGLISHRFTPDAVQAILQYTWPGNVRELKHHISRTVLLSQSAEISSASLALPHLPVVSDLHVGESNLTLEENEKKMIEHALQRTHGNVSEAARLLGITRMTIRYRMDKYGIR